MNTSFINDDFDPEVLRRALRHQRHGVAHGLFKGRWTKVSAWESAAHQRFGRDPLLCVDFANGITDEGIHHALDRFTDIDGPTVTLAPWHAGLIDNGSFGGVADADTMSSHSGWIELEDYSESVRQQLNFASAAARTISDSISFSINGSVTIKGLFVTSDNTKGGTTGTLFSTALFSTPPVLGIGNTLTANYSLSD